MTESDEQLAARAKAGDASAFEVLVRRHKSAVYGFCRRYVGDADEAYDVLQDAFASAWTNLNRYDVRRPFAAWLRTITLNKCRDHARRRSVRRLILAAFEREQAPTLSPPASETTPDLLDERLRRLDRAVADLPTPYKEVIILTTLGGLNQQDAAAQLGLSVKAVEMRVYRAKRLLSARLRKEDVPPSSEAR